MRICRVAFELQKGVSSAKGYRYTDIDMGRWLVKDAKFIDEHEMLVAITLDCSYILAFFDY